MTCERIPKCPLFAQFKLKSSLQFWKTYYCEGSFQSCERYKLAGCGQPVPGLLLPNGRTLDRPLDTLEPGDLR
jgi:hypothetical protein